MILKNRAVLVTGAGGFIGSHLVERLVEEGCKVRALVHYNSQNRWGWLDRVAPAVRESVEVVAGDIRDPYCVGRAVTGCSVVFHLAALIGIPYSYAAPDSYVDINVKGTLNVLEAARTQAIDRVLVTSTSEVYGTARYVPIDEEHPRQPQSPYSATKIAADCMAEAFHRSFELPVTIVRPFNTYGPRQSARAVIPTIITQLLAGIREIRLGSLSPTRDFNYVKDTVDGFVAIAATDATVGEDVNISTGSEVSVGDMAATLIGLIAPGVRIVAEDQRVRPPRSEVERLLGSSDKIRGTTGWTPRHTLEQGLRDTVDWFRREMELGEYKPALYNV